MGYIKNFKQVLHERIQEEIEDTVKGIDLFSVTEVDTETLTCTVKRLNMNQRYENVQIASLGIGNLKGSFMLPAVDDIVLVTFIQNSETPVIIGSIFDKYTNEPDNLPDVREDEYLISNQPNGAYIQLRDDNTITVKSVEGAKVRLKQSGGFKLFDKNNYGIESDGEGNISIFGDVTIFGDVNSLTDGNGDTVTSTNSKQEGDWN